MWATARAMILLILGLVAPASASAEVSEPLRLSELLRGLAQDPAAVNAVLERLGRTPHAPILLGTQEAAEFHEILRLHRWSAFDHFPRLSVPALGRALATAQPLAPQRHADASDADRLAATLNDRSGDEVDAFLADLERTGHHVTLRDVRRFAALADLPIAGREVATPLWIDTELYLPGSARTLSIPAIDARYELSVRGPHLHADVTFGFGLDGEIGFRASPGAAPAWTLGRTVHEFEGESARTVVRFARAIADTYGELQRAHPELPHGGYFALGTGTDVAALLEAHATGGTTLYPLTRDVSLFQGDDEVSRLARTLPTDRTLPTRPDRARLLGSLPTEDLAALPFPGLREDLEAVLAGPPPADAPWYAQRRNRTPLAFAVLLAIAGIWILRRIHGSAAG